MMISGSGLVNPPHYSTDKCQLELKDYHISPVEHIRKVIMTADSVIF